MPRFFFHVYDDEVALDAKGAELASLDEARDKAEHDARSLAASEVQNGHLGLNHRIEVVDQEGAEICTVRLQDIVTIHP